MFQLVLGWKSHSTTAAPEVIYAGANGDEAAKAILKTKGRGFVRAQKLVNPSGIPVALPDNGEPGVYVPKTLKQRNADSKQSKLDAAKASVAKAEADLKRLQQAEAKAEADTKAEEKAHKQSEKDAAKKADEAAEERERIKAEALGKNYKPKTK